MTILFALPVMAALIWSGWIAGRNGLAFAESPWRGQLFLPIEAGTDPTAWERASLVDPDEPQLHYFAAMAAFNLKDAPDDVNANALAHAKIGAALSPHDFNFPWIAAMLSERLGADNDAEAFHNRVTALYPGNLLLRIDAGMFYLRHRVAGRPSASSARMEALEKVLAHFRFVISYDPSHTDRIVAALEAAGCSGGEIGGLWQGRGRWSLWRGRVTSPARSSGARRSTRLKLSIRLIFRLVKKN